MARYLLDKAELREHFRHYVTIQTRWNDLDAYRHVNNARYYAFFDTVIMDFVRRLNGFDALDGPIIPFTVENSCRFFQSFTFPDVAEAGLRVSRIGTSSIRYEVGLFKTGAVEIYAAGYFVDVFVDRDTARPVAIPEALRTHLKTILIQGE